VGELFHVPVLVEEVLSFLDLGPNGRALDLTLGGGGHARKILERVKGSRLVGVDRDLGTLAQTAREMAGFGDRFRTVHARFDRADEADATIAPASFDGILFDLGISTLQLDDERRGLSFEADSELDMRMDRSVGETAAELLCRVSEQELADLLFRFGDERRSRAIARAIVERRRHAPVRRTQELASLVERAVGGRRGARIHPATKTFQALRIAVNDELGGLERALPKAVRWLKPGGRLVVISFHSGEDRVVKRFFRDREASGELELLNRKVVEPGPAEVAANPRARSAKLRAARRLPWDRAPAAMTGID
jgi:16S rRNA (cytosine1402-N4)-methyltransferase